MLPKFIDRLTAFLVQTNSENAAWTQTKQTWKPSFDLQIRAIDIEVRSLGFYNISLIS